MNLHGAGIDEGHLLNGDEGENKGVHLCVTDIDGNVVERLVGKLVGLEGDAVDFACCSDTDGVQFGAGVQLL